MAGQAAEEIKNNKSSGREIVAYFPEKLKNNNKCIKQNTRVVRRLRSKNFVNSILQGLGTACMLELLGCWAKLVA